MPVEVQSFVQVILIEAIRVLLPILVGAVIGFVGYGIQLLRKRLSADQIAALELAVEFAVKSAEQQGLKGLIQDTGKAKKRAAIEIAQRFLVARGWGNVNAEVIGDAIESALLDGIHKPITLLGEPLEIFTQATDTLKIPRS